MMNRKANQFPARPPRSSLYEDAVTLSLSLRWLIVFGTAFWLFPFAAPETTAAWILGAVAAYGAAFTILHFLGRHPPLALAAALDFAAIISVVTLLAPDMSLALPAFASLTIVVGLGYGWLGVAAAVTAFAIGELISPLTGGAAVTLENLVLRGGGIAVGAIVLGALVERHESLRTRLARVALKERYLGVFDLQNFAKALEYLHKLAVRGKWHYSVMVLDVNQGTAKAAGKRSDGNDTLFDLVGNEARSALRSTDLIGRVGEAMFAIALPETGTTGAENVARRLRDRLQEFDSQLDVTVGLAELQPRPTDSSEACLHTAFAKMREAKSAEESLH